MEQKDFRQRIKKLLALSKSSSEHEAKVALLKARELMAEHKLTEKECQEYLSKKILDVTTEITGSSRIRPWNIDLSAIIAEHYCCQAYRTKHYSDRLYRVAFIGFEEDVNVCVEVFRFASGFIDNAVKRIKLTYEGFYELKTIRDAQISYGTGFCSGLCSAFAQQDKNQEYGLILQIPQEVKDYVDCKDMEPEDFNANYCEVSTMWSDGYCDGRKFDPKLVLRKSQNKQTLLDSPS